MIDGKSKVKPASFTGPVTPLENVEMISMPEAGMVFYHVEVGETVKKGAKLATIVTRPGRCSGRHRGHRPAGRLHPHPPRLPVPAAGR